MKNTAASGVVVGVKPAGVHEAGLPRLSGRAIHI